MNHEERLAEVLGQMVDCAIRAVPHPKTLRNQFSCIYCHAIGDTPPKVPHRDGCLVARAQKLLRVRDA